MIDIPKNRAGISVISIEVKIVNILRLYKNRKKSKENTMTFEEILNNSNHKFL